MKRMTFMLLLFVAVVAIYAQSYIVLGEDDGGLHCVLKVTVTDSYNGAPLPNIVVESFEETYRKFRVTTNRDGVALILIYDITRIGTIETLKIHDQNYEYSQIEDDYGQYDLWTTNFEEFLAIPGSETGEIIWSGLNSVPKANIIAGYIFNQTYKASKWISGPGFFDIPVELTYSRHPKDERRGGGNSSQQYNNQQQNNSSAYVNPAPEYNPQKVYNDPYSRSDVRYTNPSGRSDGAGRETYTGSYDNNDSHNNSSGQSTGAWTGPNDEDDGVYRWYKGDIEVKISQSSNRNASDYYRVSTGEAGGYSYSDIPLETRYQHKVDNAGYNWYIGLDNAMRAANSYMETH